MWLQEEIWPQTEQSKSSNGGRTRNKNTETDHLWDLGICNLSGVKLHCASHFEKKPNIWQGGATWKKITKTKKLWLCFFLCEEDSEEDVQLHYRPFFLHWKNVVWKFEDEFDAGTSKVASMVSAACVLLTVCRCLHIRTLACWIWLRIVTVQLECSSDPVVSHCITQTTSSSGKWKEMFAIAPPFVFFPATEVLRVFKQEKRLECFSEASCSHNNRLMVARPLWKQTLPVYYLNIFTIYTVTARWPGSAPSSIKLSDHF